MPAAPTVADSAVRRLSWATLGFTVVVILGGAVVRATDSGAGCGESWPRCDGHILPFTATGATFIELTHRLMSGMLGIALVALIVLVYRRHAKGEPVRRALNWSAGLFVVEALIGAALVLFGWVEDDASYGRVAAVAIHLVNTFLLLGALTLTAYFAGGGRPLDLRRDPTRTRLSLTGAAVMLVIGASGALNALADTLGDAAPHLLDLRIAHPMMAIAGGGLIFIFTQTSAFAGGGTIGRLRGWVQAVIGLQFASGFLNIALLTPVETQVLHLLLADILWVLWIRLGAEVLAVPADELQEITV